MDDVDGDFELQAPAAGGSNGVLVPPWRYEGNISVVTDAQSPFQNVYAGGRAGVGVGAEGGRYRIKQSLRPERWRGDSHVMYVNLDFKVQSTGDAISGAHRFALGGSSDDAAFAVLIDAQQVKLQVGDVSEVLGPSLPGQWRNLQLKVDERRRVVSGRIGTADAQVEFAERPINPSWSGALSLIAFEDAGEVNAARPSIAYDNFAIQSAEIPSVLTETPPTGSAPNSPPKSDSPRESELDQVSQQLAALLAEGPVALAYGMSEGTPHNARIQLRGEPDQPGEEVPRGFIAVLGGAELAPDTSGSGRLELAHWLTSPENPLTARVLANRIWQYHLGRGLVKTPNDFGTRGLPPTHPELLDHLAIEFVRSGWSIKSLHRQIMYSATYRQDSADGADAGDFYVGFSRRRLSAEEVRDAILAVSGELDRTPGREHPFPAPTGWGFTQHAPFSAVYSHQQRSVYLMTPRLKRHPFLALFDGADPNASTPRRMETTVPTQALFFMNDPLVHSAAEAWAVRLQAVGGDSAARIDLAWRAAFGRTPDDVEQHDAQEFLRRYRAEMATAGIADTELPAWAAYLRTLLASNEFLHVD